MSPSENLPDDLFSPVPPPGTRALADLEASLRQRLADGNVGGDVIDDLRLFILARHYQQRTQAEIDDELIGWDIDPEFVIELTGSTLRSGSFGGEVTEELRVGGKLAASWQNPHAAGNRLARRVARRHSEARRLAGIEVEDAAVDLGFQPHALPRSRRRSRVWRTVFVVTAVALVVLGCGGLARLLNL